MPAPSSAPRSGAPVAMILGSCVSLQIGAAFAAGLFPALGSWGVTTLRLGLAAIVLGVVIRPALLRWDRRQWRAMVWFGLAMGGMNGSFYAAIERIPLGTAVAIEFLGPLVLSAVLSRRRLDLACVALALAGVSLFGVESFAGVTALDPVGVAFALVAGVFWAGYILTSSAAGALVPGHGSVAVAMAIGALVLMPLGAPGVVRAVTEPHLLLLALGCALLASVIPYSLELSALRRLPRHVFGILLSLEPAVAALAGLVLLGQPVTVLGIAAIALVIGASIGTTVSGRLAGRRAGDGAAAVDRSTDGLEPVPQIAHVAGALDPEEDPAARDPADVEDLPAPSADAAWPSAR